MINNQRPDGFSYIGNELELFEKAENWKDYLFSEIEKYVGNKHFSIEVGCGIGANYTYIERFSNRYLGIEPDPILLKKATLKYPGVEYINGFFDPDMIKKNIKPDLILLIDVLEHIKEDFVELNKIWEYLELGSHIVILVPAHQFLFSKFDESVGHYRRYSKKSIKKLFSDFNCELTVVQLDSFGFFLSLVARILNPTGEMTLRKVKIWNSLIPVSKKFDHLFRYKIGKSILLIAKK